MYNAVHQPILRGATGARAWAAGLALVLLVAANPATAQQWLRPTLDPALTRQAYALGPVLEGAEWSEFSAPLRFRVPPVWAGIGGGTVGLRGRPLRYARNPDSGEQAPYHLNHWLRYRGSYRWRPTPALRQLNNRMDNLDIERRQVEYERLGMTLREKVSKMRKLEAALPVLVFSLNDEGKVVEVGVDSKRSKTKLTRRSRGLMLKALRDERFRLPARQYLEEPHALAEKLQRFGLRYRVGQLGNGLIWAGRPVARPFRALLYRKVILHGRCGETRIEWMPRFWRLH